MKNWIGLGILLGILSTTDALAQRTRRGAVATPSVEVWIGVRNGLPAIFFRNPTDRDLVCRWQARARNSETRRGESVTARGSVEVPKRAVALSFGPRDGTLFGPSASCFEGRTQVPTQVIPAPASY